MNSLLAVQDSEPSDKDIHVNMTRSCFSCKGRGHKKVCVIGDRFDQPTLLHYAVFVHNMDIP